MTPRPPCRPDLLHRVLAEAHAATTDGHLLQRFIDAGDEGAFGTIVDRHGPMLLGLCRRQLHASDLAEDVLQATFLVLARKARSVRRRDNLAGWLYGVARRLVRQAERSEVARRRRERQAARAEATTESGWDDLLRVLDAELQRLPERYREPLLLCYLEGRTQDEAATHLGWSLSTLRRRLERGRELLRTRMVRRGATLGAGLLASIVAPSTARAALSAPLRQAVLAIAASALRPVAIAPAVLMLANGELRMATLTKCLLGSILALGLTAALTVSAWPTGEPAGAALQQPTPPAAAPGDEPKAPLPGRDLFGDALPTGALARLGTVELRHGPFGTALQFTLDGKHLVSSGGGWIRRWNLATGHADVSLGKDWPVGFTITRELVTADGKLTTICRFVDVPGGVDFTCTEYDLQTGKAQRTYKLDMGGATTRVSVPTFVSADGKLLAGLARDIRLWRASDGSLAHHLQLREGNFTSLAITPDGKTLFAGDDSQMIHVFDLASGREVRSFGIPNVNGLLQMAVAPDGKRLATVGGGDSFVRLWNLDRGTAERLIDFPKDGTASLLRFTPDGRTLIVGIDNERTPGRRAIRTWDVASGKAGREWSADPSIGLVFAVSADGKLLATMNGAGVIRLWDMETGQQRRARPVSPSGLQAISFAPDGKTLRTVGDDFQLRQWDNVGRQVRVPRPLVFRGKATFAPGGQLIVTDRNERGLEMVRLEDATTGQLIWEAPGQEGVVSLDGKRAATSGAELVTSIHDVAAQTRTALVPRETPSAPTLRPKVRGFTADGRSLIVQGDVVAVYDVQTGKQRSSWSLYRNKVLEIDEESKGNSWPGFSMPKGGGKGRGKGGGKGPGFSTMRSTTRQLHAVAVSPDGGKIAFALDWLHNPGVAGGQYGRTGRVMVFETMTGKLLHESVLPDRQAYVYRLAFSPDGKLLAAGGIGSVLVWQVGESKEPRRFEGHLGRVDALAFSADSRRLASASNDSTVLVWELAR